MKFEVNRGGWPVGAVLIPVSTIIDTALPQWAYLLSGPLVCGYPPPDMIALDQATYNAMVRAYGYQVVLYGPGVVPATQ